MIFSIWPTKFFLIISKVVTGLYVVAAPLDVEATTEWSLNSRFRYGARVSDPTDLATLQHQSLFLLESQPSSSWSYQVGARLRGDGAYSLNNDRYLDLELNDPPELELREANLEFRSSQTIVRVGSQVVPWGEAFGSFYADVLNHKDLREAGFGELADLRIPLEMVNLKYIQSSWSGQVIFAPFYRPNRLPRPGSDFFPAQLKDALRSFSIDFDQGANPEDQKGDLGARLQFGIGTFDVSVFGLSYIDRQPLFRLSVLSLTDVRVRTQSLRFTTLGSTLTWAGDSIVVRAELVKNISRGFNTPGGTLANAFETTRGDQDIVVVGVDWPIKTGALKDWQIGIQVSNDQVNLPAVIGRSPVETLFGVQLNREKEYSTSYRLLSAYSLADGSWLMQASAMLPHNENLSYGCDLWYFAGSKNSQFGSLHDGSRLMFVIKGVFSG